MAFEAITYIACIANWVINLSWFTAVMCFSVLQIMVLSLFHVFLGSMNMKIKCEWRMNCLDTDTVSFKIILFIFVFSDFGEV